MRSIIISLTLIILFGIIILSCKAPKELEYRDFKNFTVEKVGFATSFVKMELIYYNPNNFGMQLKNTDLDVYVDSVYVGHTTQEYQVAIPKRAEFSIPITVEVDMRNLMKNSLVSFLNKEVMLRLSGSVKVGKMNVFKTFPVQYEGKQKVTLF